MCAEPLRVSALTGKRRGPSLYLDPTVAATPFSLGRTFFRAEVRGKVERLQPRSRAHWNAPIQSAHFFDDSIFWHCDAAWATAPTLPNAGAQGEEVSPL